MNSKRFFISSLLLSGFLLAACASPKTESSQLIGGWVCNPYSMKGKDLTVTVVDKPTYNADGKYSELSSYIIKTSEGERIGTSSKLEGSWSFDGKVIYIKFNRGQFLSSDNPRYSVESGQRALDAQLQKKDWSKKEVLELGVQLVTKPVEPMYKEADVVVTCARSKA